MAHMLGVAKYDDRFVIPTADRSGDPNLPFEQGSCSLEGLAPREGVEALAASTRHGHA
jgi:nitrate reductase beta subunit